MSLYNPEGTSPIVASAVVQVERRLPHPGEVLVRVGSRVEPEDTVARAFVPAPLQVVNVAQMLSIPASQLNSVMRYSVGAKVNRGVVLADSGSLIGRNCTAPVGGIISTVDTGTGYVTIAPDPLEFTLNASLRGVVMEVQPHRGVVIETPAAQVYGVFGVGSERVGVMRLLVTDPTEVVTPDAIDARSAYSILICGAGITAAALRNAVEAQVRGVIVGGIEEQELRSFLGWARSTHQQRETQRPERGRREARVSPTLSTAEVWHTGVDTWALPGMQIDPGLTVLITEGIGLCPMSQPVFDLLSSRDRQEALIEGNTRLRRWFHRPRLILPFARAGGGQIETPRPELVPGATVRLLDRGHFGQVARVVAVSAVPRRLDSGVRTPAVEVVQEHAPPFWIPRSTVEVLA